MKPFSSYENSDIAQISAFVFDGFVEFMKELDIWIDFSEGLRYIIREE